MASWKVTLTRTVVAGLTIALFSTCASGETVSTTTEEESPTTLSADPPSEEAQLKLLGVDRMVAATLARPDAWVGFGLRDDPASDSAALVFGGAVPGDANAVEGWQLIRLAHAWCKPVKVETSTQLIDGSETIVVECDQEALVPASQVYAAGAPAPREPALVLAVGCGETKFELDGRRIALTSRVANVNTDMVIESYTTNPRVELEWLGPREAFGDLPLYCDSAYPDNYFDHPVLEDGSIPLPTTYPTPEDDDVYFNNPNFMPGWEDRCDEPQPTGMSHFNCDELTGPNR